MRRLIDAERLGRFLEKLGSAASQPGRVYLTGGATAVLRQWRPMTIDVDLKFVPEQPSALRAIPELKESLEINVELASPGDFIPELPGWEERSLFIAQHGNLAAFHYDFYAQCLAKIERGHARDLEDIQSMFTTGLVQPSRLLDFYGRIEPELFRYPALDPATFRNAVEKTVAQFNQNEPSP